MNGKLKFEISRRLPLSLALLISEFIFNKVSDADIMSRVELVRTQDKDIEVTQKDLKALRKCASEFLTISTYPACKTICERIDECHADKRVAVTKREYSLIAGLLQASNMFKCCSQRIDYIEELITRNDLLEVAAEEIDINFLSAGQLVSAMAIEFVKPEDNTLN